MKNRLSNIDPFLYRVGITTSGTEIRWAVSLGVFPNQREYSTLCLASFPLSLLV